MSNKPLTFFQQGASAGLQNDPFVQNSGFVDCENLDIFSSSQSVKATARSEPEEYFEEDFVDVCHKKRMYLKSDGRVRDSQTQQYLTDPTEFNANANIIHYESFIAVGDRAIFGTPQKILVKYEDDERKNITVFTDRMIYEYYPHEIPAKISLIKAENVRDYSVNNMDFIDQRSLYVLQGNTDEKEMKLVINIDNWSIGKCKIHFWDVNNDNNAVIKSIRIFRKKLNYHAQEGNFQGRAGTEIINIPIDSSNNLSNSQSSDISLFFDGMPTFWENDEGCVEVVFENNGTTRMSMDISIGVLESFEYLVPTERDIINSNGKIYLKTSDNRYNCYTFLKDWVYYAGGYKSRYKIIIDESVYFDNEISGFLGGETESYIFTNRDDYSSMYIVPMGSFDDIGQEQRFYGKKIINAVFVQSLIYMVVEEGGTKGLYAYYGRELKKLFSEKTKTDEQDEMITFDGKMVARKDSVIISTKDNKIFQYGPTLQGNHAGSFIGEIDGEITELVIEQDTLQIIYKKDNKTYVVKYQDTEYNKNYMQEFSITYPKIIGNHSADKEIKDITVSYLIPNDDCFFEVFVSVNDKEFVKIGEIRKDKEQHGKKRFTALTATHNFHNAHTIQIKIVGHTDRIHTPEIYSVYLESPQHNK